ncbi:MAG TPA: MgtC/SapB family protein [Chthoniobacterales bacterium]|jgi:uncharacterized membrane protein YhiD involved in acid resistance
MGRPFGDYYPTEDQLYDAVDHEPNRPMKLSQTNIECEFQNDPNAVSRVLQGILTGIGFLGAGVILRDSSGHVTGLTTAATVWICAALGVASGLGYWSVVGIALGLTVIILGLGGPIERLAERLFKLKHSKPTDPNL